MIMSQAMAAIVTPLVLALMLYIYNKKSIMGDHTLGMGSNIILWIGPAVYHCHGGCRDDWNCRTI